MVSWRERGFTLIELLVVIGILAVLLTIAFSLINPFGQLKRTTDTTAKAVAEDFISANVAYYASAQSLPWDKDSYCLAELSVGRSLADMPSCTHDLIQGGKLEVSYNNSSQLKDLYVTKCGKSAVICYSPKSKEEYEDAETHYDKFGVNQPGCPGKIGSGPTCYWCKPLLNDPQCLVEPTPTPTLAPTATLPPFPTATPTPFSPTPTPTPCLYKVGTYCVDDTKFLRNYAVVTFTDPGFPAYSTQPDAQGGTDNGWMIDLSFRPDFGGTTVVDGFGYSVNGVPVTTNADTDLWAAYAGNGSFFADWAAPSVKKYQTDITPKHEGFISMPFEWSTYVNGCGKTIYWRVVNFRTGIPGVNYDSNKFSPTYTGTVDCTTKVGVLDNGIDSWVVPKDDFNGDAVSDWYDYVIGSLDTKFRAGGWVGPE